jgi:hypothetical protein
VPVPEPELPPELEPLPEPEPELVPPEPLPLDAPLPEPDPELPDPELPEPLDAPCTHAASQAGHPLGPVVPWTASKASKQLGVSNCAAHDCDAAAAGATMPPGQ